MILNLKIQIIIIFMLWMMIVFLLILQCEKSLLLSHVLTSILANRILKDFIANDAFLKINKSLIYTK